MKELTIPELFVILANTEFAKKSDQIPGVNVIHDVILAKVQMAIKLRPKDEIKEGLKTVVQILPELGDHFKKIGAVIADIT